MEKPTATAATARDHLVALAAQAAVRAGSAATQQQAYHLLAAAGQWMILADILGGTGTPRRRVACPALDEADRHLALAGQDPVKAHLVTLLYA